MSKALIRLRNRSRAAWEYFKGVPETTSRPVELIVEITSVCNLACPMCPRPAMQREHGMMDLEMFKSIINQVKETAELVYLTGGLGDPTIHPQLGDFIRTCVENGVRVGVSTNATLLKPKVIDALLNPGPDILLLSLDGATKETHEKIRLGSNFEETMGRVDAFLAEKVKRGNTRPHVICQMVYMPINESEAEAFKKRWKSVPGVNEVRLKKFLSLKGAEYQPETHPENNDITEKSDSCILPWRQLAIGYDGSVALCCRDLDFRHPVGNLAVQSVQEIWHGRPMVESRGKLTCGRKDDLKACKGCAGVKTSPVTLLGSAMVDDYVIRRLLPMAEKITRVLGIKALDYD